MAFPPPQLYAKHLLPFGYGYPLWTPEPSHELLQLRRDGLRIGDVGVIDIENGSFDVFFNICLPRDHPLHRATGVPDDFMHVELNDWDIASFPHAEYPGRVISTSSVTASTLEPSDTVTSRPFTYEFSLSSSEGALLILPKGAESYKLRKRQLFRDIAARNAVNWYDFAQQHLGRIIAPDSLYLITGLYKTGSWSVASFHQATGTSESSAQFKALKMGEDSKMTYTWETMRALDWRVGPQIDVGIPNQSVFVSGFKIAVREGVLGKKRVEVEVDTSSSRSRSRKFSNSGNGPSSPRLGNIWKRFISRGGSDGGSKPAEQALSVATNSLKERRVTFSLPSPATSDNKGDTRHTEIHHVPQPFLSLHPSDVVNRYLLDKEPTVNVAITHDSQWSDWLDKGALTPEDLEDNSWLEGIVFMDYRIILHEGAACLGAVSDSSIHLTSIDSAAREAWNEEELDDAEEILSRKLIRHIDSDHLTLAYRALIRARLHRWDASLRDAETSIDIHPSVIAHVAKGFALFGQGKYEVAIAAFDVALRQCDLPDRDVVQLVKFIALFDIGYHAESMAGIANLIAHCSIDVKFACSSVQAEMYLRLATTAAQNEDHDRALQLLTRAQLLGPLLVVPELTTISLICGWKFDNLFFTICRQRCELLRAAGRTYETVQSFRTMMRDLGEDAKMRSDNAEWITAFTQECLQALESLGDHAMESHNHVEAVTRYSMALGMGPAAREGVLIKRSTAYAAAHIWDSALKDADEAINLDPTSPFAFERKYEALQGLGRHDEAGRALSDMRSVLERSADPQARQLGSRYDHLSGLIATTQTSNTAAELMVATPQSLVRHVIDTPDAVQVEKEAVQAQNLTAGNPERPNVQLTQVANQITILLEQLGSNATSVNHDSALRDQLTSLLKSITEFSHERDMISQQGDLHQAATKIIREFDPDYRPAFQEPDDQEDDLGDIPRSPDRHSALSTITELTERTQQSLPETYFVGNQGQHNAVIQDRNLQTSTKYTVNIDLPRLPTFGTSNDNGTAPRGSQSNLENPTVHRRESKWNVSTPNHEIQIGPIPVQVRTLGAEPLRGSTGGSEDYLGSGQAPGQPQTPARETTVSPYAATNIHVQQPAPLAQPSAHAAIPPDPSSTQPWALLNTLLEILREQLLTHRSNMDQQQELARQMRSHYEWFISEMQDRLTELRNMSARPFAHPQWPMEFGQTHLQPRHVGVDISRPVSPPFPGMASQPDWRTPRSNMTASSGTTLVNPTPSMFASSAWSQPHVTPEATLYPTPQITYPHHSPSPLVILPPAPKPDSDPKHRSTPWQAPSVTIPIGPPLHFRPPTTPKRPKRWRLPRLRHDQTHLAD